MEDIISAISSRDGELHVFTISRSVQLWIEPTETSVSVSIIDIEGDETLWERQYSRCGSALNSIKREVARLNLEFPRDVTALVEVSADPEIPGNDNVSSKRSAHRSVWTRRVVAYKEEAEFARDGFKAIASVTEVSGKSFEARVIFTGCSAFADEFPSEREAKAAAVEFAKRLLEWAA